MEFRRKQVSEMEKKKRKNHKHTRTHSFYTDIYMEGIPNPSIHPVN